MKTPRVFSIVLIVVMWAGVSAASVEVEGVRFPRDVEVKNTPMALQGYGLLRYMVFIKAYVGAFYLQESVAEQDVLLYRIEMTCITSKTCSGNGKRHKSVYKKSSMRSLHHHR